MGNFQLISLNIKIKLIKKKLLFGNKKKCISSHECFLTPKLRILKYDKKKKKNKNYILKLEQKSLSVVEMNYESLQFDI